MPISSVPACHKRGEMAAAIRQPSKGAQGIKLNKSINQAVYASNNNSRSSVQKYKIKQANALKVPAAGPPIAILASILAFAGDCPILIAAPKKGTNIIPLLLKPTNLQAIIWPN